jgi:choline-sulfatase
VIPAGQRCRRVASALDVTATLLDVAGAPALPDMVGRSLLGLLGVDREASGSSAVPRPASAEWEDVAFSEFCVEEGWYQRMVRSGPWKLCHYHGYRPQLFNLEDDPDEVHDLAQAPRYASVRDELTARVLDGWDAEEITREQALKRAQLQVLRAWAQATRPQEQHRWPITREMHWLDEEPPTPAR